MEKPKIVLVTLDVMITREGKNRSSADFIMGTGAAAWHIINQSKLNNELSALVVKAFNLIRKRVSERLMRA